ncbi:DUF7511 domain-containing protein [Haloterrigena gelatinilytica]
MIRSAISDRSELVHVVVENLRKADECILFPGDATEDELQGKWIRAKEGAYVHSEDAQ